MSDATIERPALLAAFQDGDLGNEICSELELDLEFYPAFDHRFLGSWGLNAEAAQRLHPFAQDGTGGMVCLWQPEGREPLDQAPVILLGSEGDVQALARNIAEFLVQVAWGYDPFNDDPQDLVHDEGARVLGEHGVMIPDQAEGLREAARAAYPDCKAWMYAHLRQG